MNLLAQCDGHFINKIRRILLIFVLDYCNLFHYFYSYCDLHVWKHLNSDIISQKVNQSYYFFNISLMVLVSYNVKTKQFPMLNASILLIGLWNMI